MLLAQVPIPTLVVVVYLVAGACIAVGGAIWSASQIDGPPDWVDAFFMLVVSVLVWLWWPIVLIVFAVRWWMNRVWIARAYDPPTPE